MPAIPIIRSLILAAAMLALTACGGGSGGNNGQGGGGGGGGGGAPSAVTVSGTVSYEFVPPNAGCIGLNFTATTERPIRGATVVLLNSANTELARTVSSDAGFYSFSTTSNTTVRLRVLAEAKRSGTPGWDVEVRDNVDTSATPVALGSRPMYTVDGDLFDTGSTNMTRNLLAEHGWTGSSYAGPRAAAPFAILDTIYTGMQFVIAQDPSTVLPPLDAFWSVNNRRTIDGAVSGDGIATGDLGGSFYFPSLQSLFITGDASDDTSEYDAHVVGHEWGHFLDDVLFRSDSPAGTHFLGDRLDSRLAWSEAWPTALAAMFLENPLYCSTTLPNGGGFGINAEGGAFGGQGWFDEVGIIRFIYDLWDTTSEGTDTGSVGFEPIYEVMTGGFRTAPTWANIYTFAVELKKLVDDNGDALIDSQLGDEQTVNGALLDEWGSNETNDGGANAPGDVLPLYIDMVADGTTANICSNSQFDFRAEKDGNKLSEFRYIRLTLPLQDEYNLTITSTTPTPPSADPDDRDQSDPDMYISYNGLLVEGFTSGDANSEIGTTQTLPAGTYVADLRDWRYADPERSASYPPVVCFDVRFDPTP